jgi:2-oxoisovalerate dehydrogenase E1 component
VVVEGAEFADYIWPGMEQVVECSHDFWRSNGKFAPNVVIRLASGGYIGGGLYHSQNLEGTFSTLPGLRIVIPSFADDAYGLFRQAMHSKGPTIFLEPKHLYNHPLTRVRVAEDHIVPFGKAKIRRVGEDLTIVTYGTTTHFSLKVADEIESETGASIEVIDLRSLYPLDEEAIYQSVKKTNRCLVVHEDKIRGGFGGEISALVTEKCFEHLDAPVKRVGSEFTPVGFNRILERAILIDQKRIKQACEALLDY